MRSIFLSTLNIMLFFSSLFSQNTVGLIQTSPAVFPGYTLFAPNASTQTYLIDNEGRLVHQWSSGYLPTMIAYLLPDGNLLRASAIEASGSPLTGGFQLFTWDGDLLWEYYAGTQHHDIEALPNGNVLIISNDRRTAAQAIAAGRNPALIEGSNIRSLSLQEIQQTGPTSGSVVWEWKAWDHLIQDFDPSKPNYGEISSNSQRIDLNFTQDGGPDWLHTNSVAYHADLDQIVVSNRSTHEIWIIDHSTTSEEAATESGGNSGRGGALLYRWGNPAAYGMGDSTDQRLFAQHDARWIAEGLDGAGHLLVFNNGLGRPDSSYSSVDEIITPVDTEGLYTYTPGTSFEPENAVWSFAAMTDFSYYSPRYGGGQRLPNGNTLICSATEGRFFEITPDTSIIWLYVNPVAVDGILNQGDLPEQNEVGRANRYAVDFPGFDGKDLTPGLPIEETSSIWATDPQRPDQVALLPNFPNPFNPKTNLGFRLDHTQTISLSLFDLQGRELVSLLNATFPAGTHRITWDGRDRQGNPLPSGVYLVSLDSDQSRSIQKVTLLR